MINEYRMLRQCILGRWEREAGPTIAVSESPARFSRRPGNRRIGHELCTRARADAEGSRPNLRSGVRDREGRRILHQILLATLETTEAVDTAAVLLREGDVLRMRAAVGLEEEVDGEFTLKVGEGVAGRIVATGQPMFLRHAAADPLVENPTIRKNGVRALYGIPLTHADVVLGVSYIGSRTAFEFSEEDKLLFRTMASRATSE